MSAAEPSLSKAPDNSTSKKELEDAADYLNRHNFKTLVEWFTAEVILNRPKDPISFIRDIVHEKIDKRNGKAYQTTDPVTYAKECYTEASDNADEDGQVKPRAIPRKPESLADTVEMRKRLDTLEQAIKSSRAIAKQLNPFSATQVIVKETCNLLHCDRATLFTTDFTTNELQLMVAEGAEGIRLPIGQGIAGSVAATGTLTNIPDAYDDARFSAENDEKTGYQTKSILAAPVINGEGETVGVIQAINRFNDASKSSAAGLDNYNESSASSSEEEKKDADVAKKLQPFSKVDEEMIAVLAGQAGIALQNASLYQDMAASQAKIQSLLDIIQAMHSNLGINSLLFTITQRAHELVEADRCTMFLLDKNAKELMSLQGEVNLRIPMDKGIAGECCSKNEIINIPDAYADKRFNQSVDLKSGYKTKTILCMPCRDSEGQVVGVIQLINKPKTFTEEDIRIMDSFLIIAGPILAQSQLFQQRSSAGDDGSNEFTGKNILERQNSSLRQKQNHESVIEEGEEEEEEEEDD